MASTVKFKFKSARVYDTVSFPGTSIKLLDLKRAIVEQKRLHQGMEFDLTVVNDKTKEGAYIFMSTTLHLGQDPISEQHRGLTFDDNIPIFLA